MTNNIKEEDKKNLPSWNLKDLYTGNNDPKIKQDMDLLFEQSKKFKEKYYNKLTSISKDEFITSIKEYEQIQDLAGKLSAYAYLQYSENITEENNVRTYQNISEKLTELNTIILFFTLEINKLPDTNLKAKLEGNPYSSWIRDITAFKPYQLSDELEEMLTDKYVTTRQSWSRLFDESLASLKFPYKEKILSCAEILDLLSSKDNIVRKNAAKAFGKTLGENIKIFANITNVLAKDKQIDDKWRKFKHPISSRNLSNYIEDCVVESLIDTVKANYKNLAHRYYKLKAKAFGVEKLYYWDRNAPYPNAHDKYISWDEAKRIVLNAYSKFSPKMADIAKEFFDKNWIDACIRTGKESGAFSHPVVASLHPYILMNYQGKARDVMTLAHELGHGVHQMLSRNQGTLMCDTPLTLAETASVFGEQLVFRSLLEQESEQEQKKLMLAEKIEDMLNTVVRQIAFCEFELKIHEKRKEGELSTDEICEFWLEAQKESLGDNFIFEEEYRYFWAYISHFIHSPFYVYAYAFGDCLVNSLYSVYQSGLENFQDKYIEMLSAGGTLRHKELLAPFGLDATKPEFWQKGLDVIAGFIDELE